MKTSATYKAYLISEDQSQGDIWSTSEINQKWHVQSATAGTALTMDDCWKILADTTTGGPVINKIGTGYPVSTSATPVWQDMCVLRSIKWTTAGTGLIANLNYSTRYFESSIAKGLASNVETIGSATTLTHGCFLAATVLPTVRTRATKVYRDNPSMTGPSPGLDESSADIGGASKVADIDVRQVALRMRMTIDAEVVPLDTLEGVIAGFVGKRNSSAFLGYGTKNLLCDGASINHLEHEYYEIVMDYLYDEYFFHSQVPNVGTDGRPIMSQVYWRRERRDSVDFNNIWGSNDLGKSAKYQVYTGIWY